MAKPRVILALDSGVLISAEKDARVEAVIRRWIREGAQIVIPAPTVAEAIRGGANDAVVNRLIQAVDHVVATSEIIARVAGARLRSRKSVATVDALVVATAEAHAATDILTTDPHDIQRLCEPSINVIAL